MLNRHAPPLTGSHGTGSVWTVTPSLQLTVIVIVNVSAAVMVAPADTDPYAWLTAQGSDQCCVEGSYAGKLVGPASTGPGAVVLSPSPQVHVTGPGVTTTS